MTNASVATMDLLEVFAERGVAPKPGQAVVDIGCGSGVVGFSLIRHIADAYCISIDRPEVLDVARNQAAQIGVENRVTFRPGDSGNLGLEPDSVNVALLINVAQYLDDDELHACVAGVRSALLPGGVFYVRASIAGEVDEGSEDAWAALPELRTAGSTHQRTEDEYLEVFTSAGFDDVTTHPGGRFVLRRPPLTDE